MRLVHGELSHWEISSEGGSLIRIWHNAGEVEEAWDFSSNHLGRRVVVVQEQEFNALVSQISGLDIDRVAERLNEVLDDLS